MFRRGKKSGEVCNWMISKIDDCTDEEIVPVIVEKTLFTYTFRINPAESSSAPVG
jgi:hypothetical protein